MMALLLKALAYDEPEEAHDNEFGYEMASFDIRVRF